MKILRELDLNDVVFLDIETVRIVDKLEKGTPLYESWDYKLRYSREAEKFEGGIEEQFEAKAALYAEFAKIVCITIGKVVDGKVKLKSFVDNDERKLLVEYTNVMEALSTKNKRIRLAGHALLGFDIPFIMRRCLINGVTLPSLIDIADQKPWTLSVIDTLNLWKSTGFYSASLLNISTALGLPSPKSDINGSETSNVYWRSGANVEFGLDRIRKYCERDVVTVANVVLKIRGEEALEGENSDIKIEKTPLMERIFNTGKVTDSDKREIDEVMEMLDEHEKVAAKDILEATLPKTKKINKK